MNISNNPRAVTGAENSYQKFLPQIGLNPAQKTNPAQQRMNDTSTNINKIDLPRDILSARELETLQALFNGMSDQQTFYGGIKVNNIQSGFLLDIKG